jgi:LacI family transcriptional regulator
MTRSKVTIGDVAAAAGVSTQTVSRVINERQEVRDATRAHVLSVIENLGYRPSTIARGLVTNQTYSIGLVLPDIANPFFPEIARGAEDAAWELGYGMFLYNTGESPKREQAALQLLEDKKVDGVIICSPRQADEELYSLLEGGRRSQTMLSGPPASPSGSERIRSFTETLTAAGLPPGEEQVVPCEASFPEALRVALAVLQSGREIDGLVCYNDTVAAAAIHACVRLGLRVPDDVAVVGNDDTPTAVVVTPALTTVRIPMYEIGVRAARMLIDRIRGGSNAEHVVKPELVVRQSAP